VGIPALHPTSRTPHDAVNMSYITGQVPHIAAQYLKTGNKMEKV
jgi:hypothetical protein